MKSDAELFGLGKGRKLKFGESGTEESDFEPTSEVPETPETLAPKQPLSYDGNDTRQSQTQPVGVPQQVSPTPVSDIAPKPEAPPVTPPATNSNVGHDGIHNGMNREQYRDAWMSSGVNSVQGMKDWLAKNGGEWLSDNGTVMTPFGEQLDMGGNARGSAAGNGVLRPAWGGGPDTPSSDPIAAQSLEDILAGSSGAAGAVPTSMTTTQTTGGGQSLEDILASDPAIAGYRRSASRDFGRLRAQSAEQAAVDGTAGSGGQDGRVRQLQEAEAEAVAGFTGNRAADAQQMQIQQDQFAKSLGFNYDQLSQQQKQWLGNLNQNKEQFLASLGLSERQLSAQQKRDMDQLGFAYDQFEANQNNIAADRALGR